MQNSRNFAAKLEILILFILNGHRVVKRGVYFFRISSDIPDRRVKACFPIVAQRDK